LRKFQHPLPNHQSCHAMPHISVSDQLTSKPYNLQQKRTIQQKFLLTRLLSHAFNPSLERFYIMLEEIESPALPVFNEIGTQQSNPTTTTNTAINELMDFLTTHPNGIIRYYVSGMVLYVDTDNAAYKSMRQKKIQGMRHAVQLVTRQKCTRSISCFFGTKDPTIMLIPLQNIIHQYIILQPDQIII